MQRRKIYTWENAWHCANGNPSIHWFYCVDLQQNKGKDYESEEGQKGQEKRGKEEGKKRRKRKNKKKTKKRRKCRARETTSLCFLFSGLFITSIKQRCLWENQTTPTSMCLLRFRIVWQVFCWGWWDVYEFAMVHITTCKWSRMIQCDAANESNCMTLYAGL